MANTIGAQNPFRYRGYYHDSETSLYYLNSRYYDPAVGRFVNADRQLNPGEGISGYNLFAYCGDNPINFADPSGQAWYHWLIGGAVVVGLAIAVVVTSGGIVPALYAVGSVALGVAAPTVAATVAAGAFLGGAAVFGYMVLDAATTSSSLKEFADKGNWGTVAAVGIAAAGGGFGGYGMYQSQNAPQAGGGSGSRNPNAVGKAGEDYANITGPKTSIKGPISDRSRIPEALDLKAGTLTECKNVARLSYTSQLRDYVQYSRENGLQMILWIGETAILTQPMQDAIIENGIQINLFPW